MEPALFKRAYFQGAPCKEVWPRGILVQGAVSPEKRALLILFIVTLFAKHEPTGLVQRPGGAFS